MFYPLSGIPVQGDAPGILWASAHAPVLSAHFALYPSEIINHSYMQNLDKQLWVFLEKHQTQGALEVPDPT